MYENRTQILLKFTLKVLVFDEELYLQDFSGHGNSSVFRLFGHLSFPVKCFANFSIEKILPQALHFHSLILLFESFNNSGGITFPTVII